MLIAKEISDYIRFKELNQRNKDIIFYSEDEESFFHFEGIINHLTIHLNLKLTYITSQYSDPILSNNMDNVDVFYFKKLLPTIIRNLKSKALIMTMPDLGLFHIKRSKYGTNHIYIFHNIGSSFPVIRYGALFHYDTIFCVGMHHKIEIKKQEEIYNLNEKKLLDFGYHKLELIKKQFDNYNNNNNNNKTNKIKILIAPSWGDNSILNYCGIKLIQTLLNNGSIVIVRPHPMTFKKSKKLINQIIKDYNQNENFFLEKNISSTDSFYNADILVTDWSGVAYEYAFGTGKPILFIDVPQKIVNPRYKEIGIDPVDISVRDKIGKVLKLKDIDKISDYVNELIINKDKYFERINKSRDEMVYNFGTSSKVGATYIASLLKN